LRHVFVNQLTLMAQIGIHPHERRAAQAHSY
jgi:dihydroneopterin aldolase